ncbi:MAG: M48 family metalloprotease, partial [Proteobacteria bacterium]|nr:M48 family metalloprotease [Pseudomonadota bacterium]
MALNMHKLNWTNGLRKILSLALFWLMMVHSVSGSDPGSAATNSSKDFNIEAATQAYLEQIPAAQRTRSDAYFEGGYWLQLWQYIWGAGIALLLLQSRLSARLRDMAVRWTRLRPLQTALYALAYIFLTAALAFPLTLYSDFYREHQYGLATQSFAAWLGDQFKGLLLSLIFGCLLIVVLVGIVRRLKTSWHIWGSAFVLAFVVFAALISPVFIAPLFNNYTLLSDPKVLNPILSLARANGIATDKVYEMDASRQTTRVSANVSGLLGTMRITLNDNLVNRCSLPEIEAVMAHEMGHYVLNHVYKLLLFLGVVITIGFGVLR